MRFGDALRTVQDHLDARNYYAFNPAFDTISPEQMRQRLNGNPMPNAGSGGGQPNV